MTGRARVDFTELHALVRLYEKRARDVFKRIGPSAAEAMVAEVLEVFETEGYGEWPPFAWQRDGLPPPGTPMGKRFGPVRPSTGKKRDREWARAREAKKQQRKLRARFGYAMGAVDRNYGGASMRAPKKPKRQLSAKTKRQHRRFKGGSAKLLQDTGNLVGSITPEWDTDYVEAFTNVPYAKYHISPLPRHKIPLRDFFDIDMQRYEQDVVNMLLAEMLRPIAANETGPGSRRAG